MPINNLFVLTLFLWLIVTAGLDGGQNRAIAIRTEDEDSCPL